MTSNSKPLVDLSGSNSNAIESIKISLEDHGIGYYIPPGASISGDIHLPCGAVIAGAFNGILRCDSGSVVIQDGAVVIGHIEADRVYVEGQVLSLLGPNAPQSSIIATEEICTSPTAVIEGTVWSRSFAIQEGSIKGAIHQIDDKTKLPSINPSLVLAFVPDIGDSRTLYLNDDTRQPYTPNFNLNVGFENNPPPPTARERKQRKDARASSSGPKLLEGPKTPRQPVMARVAKILMIPAGLMAGAGVLAASYYGGKYLAENDGVMAGAAVAVGASQKVSADPNAAAGNSQAAIAPSMPTATPAPNTAVPQAVAVNTTAPATQTAQTQPTEPAKTPAQAAEQDQKKQPAIAAPTANKPSAEKESASDTSKLNRDRIKLERERAKLEKEKEELLRERKKEARADSPSPATTQTPKQPETKVAAKPVATPAVPEEMVPAGVSGVARVENGRVVMTSGDVIVTGSTFKSGERLVSTDPSIQRITTDRRSIVLLP